MKVNEFIATRRAELGMTQEQLGDIIGKRKDFISRIESGKIKDIKKQYIVPLANALKVPVDMFLDCDVRDYEQITEEEFINEIKSMVANSTLKKEKKDAIESFLNMVIK